MSQEALLQHDMFTGELVDTRTRKQKQTTTKKEKPQQLGMFAPREVAQFGVHARPSLPAINSRGMPIGMALEIQDPRTEEDKEHDRMKAAEKATYALFEQLQEAKPVEEQKHTKLFPSGLRLELREVELDAPNIAVHVDEGIDLLFWSNREAGFEEANGIVRRYGYRPFLTGDNEIELWKTDDSGYFRITYSPMEMIEDISWFDQKGGL
jgi:hypothetical protein